MYGASAGALNATYFLSGQREGVDIYHQHIATSEVSAARAPFQLRCFPHAPSPLHSRLSSLAQDRESSHCDSDPAASLLCAVNI